MSLAPGTRLGPYEILSTLGAGGMGEVYVAFDPALDRKIAIKILHDAVATDPERRGRFEREARAIAALNHPNIVTIHAIDDAGGVRFLAMELVDGKTLDEALPQGGMPFDRLLQIAIPLTAAVSAAHERGITHRDLKPQNVMIGTDGRVKVLDFGLAKLREPVGGPADVTGLSAPHEMQTGDGRILGTVAYMSPEQAEGKEIDHRTDLFSLGVILFEMATGQRPFTGDSYGSVLASVVRDTPLSVTGRRPDLSPDFARIVRKALSKDPERRYQTAADLRNDLEALRDDVSSSGVRSNVSSPRSARARKWMPIAAIAGIGWVVVAGAVGYFRGGWTTGKPAESAAGAATFRQLTFQPGLEIYPSLSPDGKWIVYSSATDGDEDIYLQSVGGQKAINLTADSPEADREPAFSPDGERIAFRSDRNGGGIFVMGQTGDGARRITEQGFTPTWAPDGRQIAYSTADVSIFPEQASDGGEVWIADIETGRKRMLLQRGSQPAWSPDGSRIAFRAPGSGSRRVSVATIPSAGGTAVQLTTGEENAWSPAWSVGGRLYYASDVGGSYNIWRVRVDAATGAAIGTPQSVTAPTTLVGHLSLSADGHKLVYASLIAHQNVQRVAFDPVTARTVDSPTWITTGSQTWDQLAASKSGDQLALRSGDNLFVARMDGTGTRQLTDGRTANSGPVWAHDGSRLWFGSNQAALGQIWSIGVDGSGLKQVTFHPVTIGRPIASPDGRRFLAHSHFAPNATDIVMFDANGQMIRALTPSKTRMELTDWSPDGERLALNVSAAPGGIVVYSLDQGRYEQLTSQGADPAWANNETVVFANVNKLSSVNVRTRQVRDVIATAPDLLGGLAFTADRHWLYYWRGPREADIWIATMK